MTVCCTCKRKWLETSRDLDRQAQKKGHSNSNEWEPSASQGKQPHEKQSLSTPRSWTSSPKNVRKLICYLSICSVKFHDSSPSKLIHSSTTTGRLNIVPTSLSCKVKWGVPCKELVTLPGLLLILNKSWNYKKSSAIMVLLWGKGKRNSPKYIEAIAITYYILSEPCLALRMSESNRKQIQHWIREHAFFCPWPASWGNVRWLWYIVLQMPWVPSSSLDFHLQSSFLLSRTVVQGLLSLYTNPGHTER